MIRTHIEGVMYMSEVKVIKAETKLLNRRRNGNIAKQIRVAPYCRVSTGSEEQHNDYLEKEVQTMIIQEEEKNIVENMHLVV